MAAELTAQDTQIAQLKQIIAGLQDNLYGLTQPKYNEYLASRYNWQMSIMKSDASLFKWQHFASNVMMFTTVAVVLSGLAMAAVQLRHAMKIGQNTDGTVDVSAQGIKITSAIVGIVVLGMSIAFLVIFTDKIYTIHPLVQTVLHVAPPLAPGLAQ